MCKLAATAAIFFIVATAMPSHASQTDCKVVASMAEKIMIARQNGMPRDEVRSLFHQAFLEEGYDQDYETMQFVDKLIDSAYMAVRGSTIVKRQEFVNAMKQGANEYCLNNMFKQ
ncbi:hypothetical protein JL101_036050 (plasmid) [Skermanella rosea]|uniref:hypothetical protein n=1 Tax=Skermanella rosea TaxID=1817965 RepID=UPI0019337F69|nr:hypothetical protein [Skermanella rosea]UEM08173.1 hypothetical protein JL101_036050 [Skermanella rosea]